MHERVARHILKSNHWSQLGMRPEWVLARCNPGSVEVCNNGYSSQSVTQPECAVSFASLLLVADSALMLFPCPDLVHLSKRFKAHREAGLGER